MRSLVAAFAVALVALPLAPAEEKVHPDVAAILKAIQGKEHLPAGEVFKNVQVLKDIPAAQFLRIMDVGYSRSLGVGCMHCHSEDQRWDADERRPKMAARDMALMTREINAKLANMQFIDSPEAIVNCTTCHRGSIKPSTTMR
ncbi:MAG TPA: c-type cytochrome [Thermoanaerobaculia bacterium]|jgi:photosynthetic reaction center cytochrome c subunit